MILGQIFAIPQEIHEAAILDNITGWRREWYITIPMIKDTLKTVAIMAATSGFLLYNEVFFLTNGAAGTKVSVLSSGSWQYPALGHNTPELTP